MFVFEKGAAMITGGGSGTGRATALMLARMGVPVGVADIDRATIEQTITTITDAGGEALAVPINVQDQSPVDTAFAIVFPASRQARYVNGHTLPVDGGYLASGMLQTGAISIKP